MDFYTKQWYPEYMTGTGTGPAGWEYAMGLDMSVSPGTVIRPDMPLGSGPAKSAENGTDPILMKQQDMASGSGPWMPPKRPRCSETRGESETGAAPMPMNCQPMLLCPMPEKSKEMPARTMPEKCMPEKCRVMPACPMPEKCMPEKCVMPARTMPEKCREMPAHTMPENCIPVCVMPMKCPEKEKEAMAPMRCPNMATSPAFVRCPEMPTGTAPATRPSAPAPAPAENIDLFPVGMAYVPWQCWQEVYPIDVAINMGTIFPDLSLPFIMGGCH